MDIPRGHATYGPGSSSKSTRGHLVSCSGTMILEMLEVPCFTLLNSDGTNVQIIGNYGHEEARERSVGGVESASARTFGGITIRHELSTGTIIYISSEARSRSDSDAWRVSQRFFESGVVMLSNDYDELGLRQMKNMEWSTTTVNVEGVHSPFNETELPSSKFMKARLLVGQSDLTDIAVVSSDEVVDLALRKITEVDLDLWLKT